MCFSATASFVAAGGLSVIFLLSIASVRRLGYLPLACIPALFAIQQFCEGLIWIAEPYGLSAQIVRAATYIFIVIAAAGWPFWIPFSLICAETDRAHKWILILFGLLGTAYASLAAWYILTYGVTADTRNCHIFYELGSTTHHAFGSLLIYCICTIVPLFASTIPAMVWYRWLALLTFLVTMAFYTHYLVSVWCFFAAIMSLGIYFVIRSGQHARNPYVR